MNQVFLQRDKGPVVQIGHVLKGCVIITHAPDHTVSVATDGLTIQEEIQALERALIFAKNKLDWKKPYKIMTTDPKDSNITYETWEFATIEQSQHFGFQMALAGLPMSRE